MGPHFVSPASNIRRFKSYKPHLAKIYKVYKGVTLIWWVSTLDKAEGVEARLLIGYAGHRQD